MSFCYVLFVTTNIFFYFYFFLFDIPFNNKKKTTNEYREGDFEDRCIIVSHINTGDLAVLWWGVVIADCQPQTQKEVVPSMVTISLTCGKREREDALYHGRNSTSQSWRSRLCQLGLHNSLVMMWLINSMESHIGRTYLFLWTAKPFGMPPKKTTQILRMPPKSLKSRTSWRRCSKETWT